MVFEHEGHPETGEWVCEQLRHSVRLSVGEDLGRIQCPACSGSGYLVRHLDQKRCLVCGGTGTIQQEFLVEMCEIYHLILEEVTLLKRGVGDSHRHGN